MKTVKILLLFVASLAILSSCKKEEPTIKFNPTATSSTVIFTDADVSELIFDVIVDAEAGINSFKITETAYAGSEVKTTETRTAEGYSGEKSYTYNFTETEKYTKTYFGDVTKVEILFEVIDKKDQKASLKYTLNGPEAPTTYKVTFTVNVDDAKITLGGGEPNGEGEYVFEKEAGEYDYTVVKEGYEPATGTITVVDEDITEDVVLEQKLDEAIPHTWTRTGTQESPYDPVGLKYKNANEAKAVYAPIVKNTASKMVNLSEHFGEITTKEQLKKLIDEGADNNELKLINVDASADYTVAIGTKVGEEYYLVNITHADISSDPTDGTTVSCTTNYQK